MKKIISIILSLVMLVSVIGAMPVSAKITFINHNTFYEDYEGRYYTVIDGVYYTIFDECCDDYVAYVSGFLPSKECKRVEIVDELSFGGDIIEVNSINIENQTLFSNLNSSVEEIVIGDNINSIRGLKFLPNLKKVTVGSRIYTIYDSFVGCPNLEVIEGDSSFIVEDGMLYEYFKDRKYLISVLDSTAESLEIKSGTTDVYIPFGQYGNVTVKNMTINENLNELKTGRIKKLKTITFGENVNKIRKIDLYGVRNLKTLDLSNIKVNSFNAKGVWHMKSVTFGKIKKLVKHSFRGCKSIEKIEFKEEIPKIYKDAFKNKKQGIEFYVKDKTAAKTLKTRLKGKGIKNAKIYAKGKLVYKNVK